MGEIPNESLQQYFASFADGDGSLGLQENRRLVCGVYQSSNSGIPEVLRLYKDWFGGNLYHQTRRDNKTEYSLKWDGKSCVPLLNIITSHSIIKAPQAVLALEWLTKSKGPERDLLQEPRNVKFRPIIKR